MPRKRFVLTLDEWPEQDRQRWLLALRGEELFVSQSIASAWRPRTVEVVAAGYGYALWWLNVRGLLDAHSSPSTRWDTTRLLAFLKDMQDGRLRSASIRNRLVSLERALAVLEPGSDRSSLKGMIRTLPQQNGSDHKRPRLRDPAELVDLGFCLMFDAETAPSLNRRMNAAMFRDGLQLALLALRPLRKRIFSDLVLGQHVIKRGDQWWLALSKRETKTHTPLDVPWPSCLVASLQRYLDHYRPILAGSRYRGNRLWIGYRYGPEAAHTIQLRLVEHTERAFGRAINPHLFRDCAATFIAIHDPQNIRMAAAILGHRTLATTQKHYNLARGLDAARSYHEVVRGQRQLRPSRTSSPRKSIKGLE